MACLQIQILIFIQLWHSCYPGNNWRMLGRTLPSDDEIEVMSDLAWMWRVKCWLSTWYSFDMRAEFGLLYSGFYVWRLSIRANVPHLKSGSLTSRWLLANWFRLNFTIFIYTPCACRNQIYFAASISHWACENPATDLFLKCLLSVLEVCSNGKKYTRCHPWDCMCSGQGGVFWEMACNATQQGGG